MKWYCFNIDPIYKKICNQYELFSVLKRIYLTNKDSLSSEYLFSNLTKKINKKSLNNNINKIFIDNKFYNYSGLYHKYYNKYRDESFSLKVCNNMIIYNGNHQNKILFKLLHKYHFFICNFEEQDYFWSNEISC